MGEADDGGIAGGVGAKDWIWVVARELEGDFGGEGAGLVFAKDEYTCHLFSTLSLMGLGDSRTSAG